MVNIVNKGVILGIVALLLVGGGAYYFMSNKSGGLPSTTSTPSGQTTGSVFSSIKDALSKSLSLECSFTDTEGRQTKSYVKNGAVRADITAPKVEDSGSVIVKDKKIYFWNSKGGFMMEVPETTPGAGQPSGTGSQAQAGNVLDTMEKYKSSCKPGVVADNLFIPPTTVQFQDFSKMMQPSAPPVGAAVPTIDYSKYMQNPPKDSGY